jgi:hypothetical protein
MQLNAPKGGEAVFACHALLPLMTRRFNGPQLHRLMRATAATGRLTASRAIPIIIEALGVLLDLPEDSGADAKLTRRAAGIAHRKFKLMWDRPTNVNFNYP